MSQRAPTPEALDHPPRGRVLVLAPHPDDDVIGVGGTAAKHAEQGDDVKVLVVYSGLAGDPEGRFPREQYQGLRRAEALAGGAILGLSDYEFWGYPEGHEPGPDEWEAVSARLAGLIGEFRPDIIYAPWVGEQHLDHHVLACAARLSIERAEFKGEAWGYEVWSPLVATRVVDITDWYERKVAALSEHRTQLAYTDIVHKGLAVSAQRSIYLPGDALHGEAFAPLVD